MVIMDKPRSELAGLLLMLSLVAYATGCGLASETNDAVREGEEVIGEDGVGGRGVVVATTAVSSPQQTERSGLDTDTTMETGPVPEDASNALDPASASAGTARPGTDAAITARFLPPSPALETRLIGFGRLYLEFDYRESSDDRAAGFVDLVEPSLLDELTQPIPPALLESLRDDRRIVRAEFVDVTRVEPRAFQLRFMVTTDARSLPDPRSETRTILVSINDDDLVSDVL